MLRQADLSRAPRSDQVTPAWNLLMTPHYLQNEVLTPRPFWMRAQLAFLGSPPATYPPPTTPWPQHWTILYHPLLTCLKNANHWLALPPELFPPLVSVAPHSPGFLPISRLFLFHLSHGLLILHPLGKCRGSLLSPLPVSLHVFSLSDGIPCQTFKLHQHAVIPWSSLLTSLPGLWSHTS